MGHPLIHLVDGQVKVEPTKGKTIDQSFTVKTSTNEQIKIELGKDFYLIVFPESSLKIEGFYITKKDYKVKAVIFDAGRFYLKNGSNLEEDLSVTYQSDFFIWKNTEKNNQREFFVELNPAIAQVRFCAGTQGIAVALFDHETVKNLKFQEGAAFQGVLQKNGELEFDLLLEGRKVPKGEWKEAFTCDFKQILKEMNDLEASEIAKIKKNDQQKKAAEKKRKVEFDKSLCHEPNGQFNECLWKWEDKSCIRYRCDGQGQWKDRQQLPKNSRYQCETKPKVSKCDY
ncbi:hypothetical protein CIK05_07290 [Bdellovibrio sp. qaytius]|nr:hypothetical protein CIK05_07290 [Bdellovibrio sp. qaytius]